MQPITIPQKFARNDDLVVIPRKEYEGLLRARTQKPSKKLKRTYSDLDRDLDKAIKEYRKGKYYGPFSTVEDSMAFLNSRRSDKKAK